MGKSSSGGGGGGESPKSDPALEQQRIASQNTGELSKAQTNYLTYAAGRTQQAFDLQNKLNALDFNNYDINKAIYADTQNRALNATRGFAPITNIGFAQQAENQNQMAELKNQLNQLQNQKYNTPSIALQDQLNQYIGGQEQGFGNQINDFYSRLAQQEAQRTNGVQAPPQLAQATAAVGNQTVPLIGENLKQIQAKKMGLAIAPLQNQAAANRREPIQQGNQIGINQGYLGQSNQI